MKGACDGVTYKEFFKQLPDVSIALVLNGVRFFYYILLAFSYLKQIICSIDEWGTGSHTSIKFYASEYQSIFNDQLAMLKNFEQATREHNLLRKIGEAMYKDGW